MGACHPILVEIWYDMCVLKTNVRRWLVAVWTACAALGAGASTYYLIDLSGGTNTNYYPLEILNGEPTGGWTDEHKTTKLVLRRIKPGTFMMCNEVQVTLTRPFFIGVFEVTQKQYELVTGQKPSSNKGDKLPVESVSWNDIRGNCNWPTDTSVSTNSFMGLLRARTGLAFDLPTEAQWEYACRAETTGDFNVPGQSLDNLGRYADNGDDERGGSEYFYTTTTVGSYLPNAWGLYDMHGNVEEWCLDYPSSFNDIGSTDPVGDESGSWREVRGGHYDSAAVNCGASHRDIDNPTSRSDANGFRVICYSAEIVQSVTPYEGVYDGEGHGITINVVSPPTAVVSYALSEAGPYQDSPVLVTNATTGAVTVWYKVEAVGYDTVTSNGTVTITKAMYDLSTVNWNYAGPFDGDGAEKMVVLTNLPVGVTATYTGNTATEPGTYTAHATLTYDTTNYLPPVVADLEWTINRPTTFGDFVNCPNLDFVTSGNANWYPVENESLDGYALRSGAITHSQTSRLDVVVSGPGAISFWCRAEGEVFRGRVYDGLAFCVDGELQGDGLISTNEWVQRTFAVSGDGNHTLSWLYIKDDEGDGDGADCAWLDTVTWTSSALPELLFTAVSVGNGAMTVAVTSTGGALSSAEVMNMLEATSDLSDWTNGALAITVEDLTQGVAQTVRFHITFTGESVPRAFLRVRSDRP